MAQTYINNYQFYFNGDMPVSATSVPITNDIESNAVVEIPTPTSLTILSADWENVERMLITATGWVLTVYNDPIKWVMRWLEPDDTNTPNMALRKQRWGGQLAFTTVFAFDFANFPTLDGTNIFTGANSFTLSVRRPNYADDVARDLAIPSPQNGMVIYNIADAVNQQYIGGAWSDISTGPVTPNASETVAGKVQLATLAQQGNQTANGTQWPLVMQAKNTVKEYFLYTPAFLTGGSNAQSNFALWEVVWDWSFRITIDWTAYNIDGIDFAGVTDMDDVADVIQAAIRAVTSGEEIVAWSVDHFIISSWSDLNNSAITVTTTSTGTVGTDISGAGASDWMDCDSGNGTVTNAVLTPSLHENRAILLDSTGKIDPDFIDNASILAEWVEALVDKDTYILWEDGLAGDSMFVEDMVTFASATQEQAIGNITANTRIAIPVFGTGVTGNSFKLSLKKFWTPWASLSAQVQTDSSVAPSGTLFDVNATSTITEWSLTTSLADTTVTLAWNITIPKWQRVWIVLNMVWDAINVANYYGIGHTLLNTTTRIMERYNGSVWAPIANNSETNAHWVALDNTQATTAKRGFFFTITRNGTVTTVTKNATANCTTAYIQDTLGNVIAQATFSTNTATFNTKLPIGNYVLLADSAGASYNSRVNGSSTTFPKNWTYCNITGGTNDWWLTNSTTSLRTFATISFDAALENNFYYVDSTLFTPKLLSKTDATYSYKLPTDLPRILTESKSAGQNAIATTFGLNSNFSGLTPLTDYYLSATSWAISSTPWNNNYYIGSAISANKLYVWEKQMGVPYTVLSSTSNSADTGTIQAITDWFVTVRLSASNGGSAIATNTLTYWPLSASATVWEIGVADASIEKATMTFPVKKWYYWRALTAGANSTTTTTVTFTPYV